MDSAPDHYEFLGLDRRCTAAQVRSAYRLLAKRYHPDLNHEDPAAAANAQQLNAAYEVLSDPIRRRDYDRTLRSSGVPPRRGRQSILTQEVHLRLRELVNGTQLEVRVTDPVHAEGAETLSLLIPSETAPGTKFRLPRREGGFVVVKVRLRPDARFKIKGHDLRTDLRINAHRAAQGSAEFLPGPHGQRLRLQVPPGVHNGDELRISGEGLPKPRGGRGDLLVRISYRLDVRISRVAR